MLYDYSSSLGEEGLVSPLDAIYQLESSSGKNKKALKPNKYGALGYYQLTPALYQDIQKHYPEFKDIAFEQAALHPEMSRKTANAGLNVIGTQLERMGVTPSVSNIALAYHSGIGNVKNNKIGPQGESYVKQFKSLTGL